MKRDEHEINLGILPKHGGLKLRTSIKKTEPHHGQTLNVASADEKYRRSDIFMRSEIPISLLNNLSVSHNGQTDIVQ